MSCRVGEIVALGMQTWEFGCEDVIAAFVLGPKEEVDLSDLSHAASIA